MALEIKVLVWDRRNNVAELNRFKDIIYRLSKGKDDEGCLKFCNILRVQLRKENY
jgi:hypothetical protein